MRTVKIEITELEGAVLQALFGQVGGDPHMSSRKEIDSVREKLEGSFGINRPYFGSLFSVYKGNLHITRQLIFIVSAIEKYSIKNTKG